MRRSTAIVAVLLCTAAAACRGGAAQEVYDGVAAAGAAAPAPAAAEPIASEVTVPWSIALISDAGPRRAERSAPVVVADRTESLFEGEDESEDEADLRVAVDHEHADEKPAAKSCTGVVNRRS